MLYAHLETAPDEALAQELFAPGSPQLRRLATFGACTTAISGPPDKSKKKLFMQGNLLALFMREGF
jgi:hypothetical protein